MTTTQQKAGVEGNGSEALAQISVNSMQTATEAYLTVWKNASRIQTELLRFMTNRLEKDFAHPMRLINCKKPDDFLEAQMDFANTLFSDYAKESRWMGELMKDGNNKEA